MHRASNRALPADVVAPKLGYIHADTCAVGIKSYGGATYFLTLTDDYSRYRKVYLLQTKDQVPSLIDQFTRWTGHEIFHFRSDEGTEFKNRSVLETMNRIGAEVSYSPPYTPTLNGISERLNRTLLNLTRTLLIESGLPKRLWSEALFYSVFALNCVKINNRTNKTPFEMVYGRKPFIKKMQPFGTACIYYNRDLNRNKLEERGLEGKIVGISDDGRSYRVWTSGPPQVVRTKDVKIAKSSPLDENPSSDNDDDDQELFGERAGTSGTSPAAVEMTEDSLPENQVETTQNSGEDLSREGQETGTVPRRLRDRTKLKAPVRYQAGIADDPTAAITEASSSVTQLADEPTCLKDVYRSCYRLQWLEAMSQEIASMKSHKVWTLTHLPKGHRTISNRWIFKAKKDKSGNIERFKARLVMKGFTQRPGIDFKELYSPVARFDTIRTIFSIAAREALTLYQFDVATAFLNSELKEEIYTPQPEGFDDGSGRVCRLLKACYGLKQAPLEFNNKISKCFLDLNMTQSISDPCLYISKGPKRLVLALYVDDGLIGGSSKEDIEHFLTALGKTFEIKSRPLDYFLGLHVECRDINRQKVN